MSMLKRSRIEKLAQQYGPLRDRIVEHKLAEIWEMLATLTTPQTLDMVLLAHLNCSSVPADAE